MNTDDSTTEHLAKETDGETRILIVDDAPDILEALVFMFEKRGYTAETAGTGQEALEKAQENFYNVALLDIRLPDMDGMELIASLREIHPDMEMIILTAYASIDTAVRALNEGAVAYVTKPMEMGEVLSAVNGAVDKQRLNIENRWLLRELQRELAERKLAEEVLQQEKDFAEGLVETARTIILVLDTEGRIVRFNPLMEEISGYRLEEVVGKDWFTTFLPQRDRDRTRTLFVEAINDIQTRGNVNPIVTRDGRERQIEWYDKTLKDTDGNTTGLLAIGQDITERKLAEGELRESEERYRGIFENSSDAVFMLSPDTEIITGNPSFEKITGYKIDELRGRSFLGFVIREDREKARSDFQERLEGKTSVVRYRIRNREGRVVILSLNTTPIYTKDKPEGLTVTARDVTKRQTLIDGLRESEEKYSSLIERANDAIFIVQDYVFKFANTKMAEFSGYSNDELEGMEFIRLLAPDSLELVRQRYEQRMAGAEITAYYELKLLARDGNILAVEANAGIIEYQGRQADMVFLRDITERKQAEEALQYRSELERIITTISTSFINRTPDQLDDGMNNALQMIGEFAGIDRSYIFLLGDNGTNMDNTHEWCAEGIEPQIDNLKGLPVETFREWMEELNRLESIYIPCVADLPEASAVKEILQPQGIQSLIIVPMTYSGSFIGYLGFDSVREKKTWSEAIVTLLKIVGGIFASALKHKESEQALKESEEHFRSVVQTATDAVISIDIRANILSWNRAAETIFGYSADEMLGKSLVLIMPERTRGSFREVLKAREDPTGSAELAGVLGKTLELQGRRKDGSEFPAELSIAEWQTNEGRFFTSIVRDITERKRMEESIRNYAESLEQMVEERTVDLKQEKAYIESIINSVPDMLLTIDHEGRISYTNPVLEQFFGRDASSVVGQPLRRFIEETGILTPESAAIIIERVNKRLQTGEPVSDVELEMINSRGEIVPCRYSASGIRSADGQLTGEIVLLRDISEQKVMEQQVREYSRNLEGLVEERTRELAESEQKYSTIVEKGNDGIIIVKDERFVFANQSIATMAGYTIDEIKGLSFDKVVTPESLSVALPRMRRRLAGEDIIPAYEIVLIHKDGKRIPAEISNTRIEYEGGYADLVVLRDITERKQAEEEVVRERDFSQNLVSTAAALIVGLNREGEIVLFNKQCEETTGWKMEEVRGENWLDLFVPERLKLEVSNGFRGIIKEDRAFYQLEHHVLTRDGKERIISWNSTNIKDEEGMVVTMISIGIDTTERKQAEEGIQQRNRELTALNEIATTASQFFDLNQIMGNVLDKVLEIVNVSSGFIVLINESDKLTVEAARGLSPAFVEGISEIKLGEGIAGIIAQTGSLVLTGDIWNDPRVFRKEAVKAEGLQVLAVVALKTKDKVIGALCVTSKEQRQVLPSDMQLLDTIGGHMGVVVENARLAEEASHAKELEELNRLRSELLANVSHELRTPLTTIKGYTSLLLDYEHRLTKSEKSQYLKAIDKSTNRQVELIDQLLDISRLEAGIFKLQKSLAGIPGLLRDVVADTQVSAPHHQITLDVSGRLPRVDIDAARVRQVVTNLIDNAIKYSDEGTEVVVSARREGRELIISVADQGIGIPAKDLERVFDRLYRIDEREKSQVGGAGLGLAICKGLVEAHGGRVWIESEEGKGSTCYFTLPLDAKRENDKE